MTRNYFKIVLFTVFLLTVENVFAQGPPPPPPPIELPVDGGIYFLLVLGAVFGIKKIWNRDK